VSTTEPVAGTAARRARRESERRPPPGPSRTPAPGTVGPEAEARPESRRLLDPDALAALEDERDFLLRSLRDLEREHEAGDVDDHDYEALKDGYTTRAADVLRAIESRLAAIGDRRPRTGPARRFVIGAAVALVAVVLGVAMAQASGRRGAGDQITGDIRQSSRDKLLDARQAMGERRFVDAINLFDDVAKTSPSNTEAHAYKGWLLVIASRQMPAGPDRDLLRTRALAELDRALELDPSYGDARVFRASLQSELGQPAAGLADLDKLQAGDVPVELQAMVESLRARLQAQASGTPPAAPASGSG
jgi:hypothetical protein